MKIKLKELLLRSSILGTVVNCLISPTYGMMQEEDRITSLTSIEPKIVKRSHKEVIEPTREDIEHLHRDIQSMDKGCRNRKLYESLSFGMAR